MSRDAVAGHGFSGEVRREKPLLEVGPILPWAGYVKVVPMRFNRGRHTATPRDVDFEVYVEWFGPPLPGFPPDPAPGLRSDAYVVSDETLARGIAGIAERSLRDGQVPDLREAARHVRARLAAGPYG